jgi:superfamily II DNA/RNA helicase
MRKCKCLASIPSTNVLCRLKEGAEIVVGTPGRIIDFVETNKLDLSQVCSYPP